MERTFCGAVRLLYHVLLVITVLKCIMLMYLCLRLDRLREERLEQEQLRKVKTLGAASEDVDDLGAWVTKSRALEEKAKAEARAKALKQARMLEEQVRPPLPATVCPAPVVHVWRLGLCALMAGEQPKPGY